MRTAQWKTSQVTAGEDQAKFAEQTRVTDVLVQPFLPEVASEGEWSLVFFGGQYSHAALKRPARGDFRVQWEFGGRAELDTPSPGLIEQASEALSKLGSEVLYARVDGLNQGGRFVLMEMEVNEPALFLGLSPDAPQRFAGAIKAVL